MNSFQTFSKDIAKYFMDFLETNFKGQKIPKRSIRPTNVAGQSINVNLKKYEKAYSELFEFHFLDKKKTDSISIRKGKYVSNIAQKSIDIINKRIESQTHEDFNALIDHINNTFTDNFEEYKKSPIKQLESFEDAVKKYIRDNFIYEVLKDIEDYVSSVIEPGSSTDEENFLFGVLEDIEEILYDGFDDQIRLFFNENTVEANSAEDIKLFETELDMNYIIQVSKDYFKEKAIDDLFLELNNLISVNTVSDKTSIYLYFYDLRYENHSYPLLYTPCTLTRTKQTINISFDNVVYLNKKAITYTVDRYFEKGTVRPDMLSRDRVIYLGEEESLFDLIEELSSDIINTFKLSPNLQIQDGYRFSKNQYIRLTNNFHFSVFEKSDESVINDYEEIMSEIDGETPLSDFFSNLLKKFIKEEPESINQEINDEWNSRELYDRIAINYPIPVNEEQRKIISSLDNDNGKYITVSGPPGTGKSHTISAIVFKQILDNKSVLILSDTKEALDVVEDKINTILSKIRHDNDFQNPLLRLGKSGNTYSKILSATSLNKIKINYDAFTKHKRDIKNRIENSSIKHKDNLDFMQSKFVGFNIDDLVSYNQYEQKNESNIYDVEEIVSNSEFVEDLIDLRSSCNSLSNFFYDTKLEKINNYVKNDDKREALDVFIAIMTVIDTEIVDVKTFSENFNIFDSITGDQVEVFREFLSEYNELRSGFFGTLFKGKQVKNLNKDFKSRTSYNNLEAPTRNLEKIKYIYDFLTTFNTQFEKIRLEFFDDDFIKIALDIIRNEPYLFGAKEHEEGRLFEELTSNLETLDSFNNHYPINSKKIGLNTQYPETIFNNKILDETFNVDSVIRHCKLKLQLESWFDNQDAFSYKNNSEEIEEYLAHILSSKIDRRVIDFSEKNKSTMMTLKGIIRKKEKFPKEEFNKLKNAFPCIISGIRDYADYIPLEKDIFDVVVIDEASQVSIAQALPALFRAKKVVIFGDEKQYSNVKSMQAKSTVNESYTSKIKKYYKTKVEDNVSHLERLKNFDVKFSILEFFKFTSNCDILLLKHFRGYQELISFSSKYFYDNSLQAIKLRIKPVSEIIEFSEIPHDGKLEKKSNQNSLEGQFIIEQLDLMLQNNLNHSVGIITPFRNQQIMINQMVNDSNNYDLYMEKLKVKVMTFDTCQGEERDVIFYSLVDIEGRNSINHAMGKNFRENKHATRLNVGFSRAKEKIHFVMSKPFEEYEGNIKKVLNHYKNILIEGEKASHSQDTDPRSKMETKVLDWIKKTNFYNENKESIQLEAQFNIGQYLNQLDNYYNHPHYKTDFRLSYTSELETRHFIIEYDGFEYHFIDRDEVNENNWQNYYKDSDLERQYSLERYGFEFIRLNRFNCKDDPVAFINTELENLVKKKRSKFDSNILKDTIDEIKSGELKKCPGCKTLRPIAFFKNRSLKSGIGLKCKKCVPIRNKNKGGSYTRKAKKKKSSGIYCPECGSTLIRRSGRYGDFRGCSSYPKCTYTAKIYK